MGCPRGATIASAALLYLAYYLRCCVKDLAVRSPAVGALAANRMPAYLYRSNNDTKLLAHLARAAGRRPPASAAGRCRRPDGCSRRSAAAACQLAPSGAARCCNSPGFDRGTRQCAPEAPRYHSRDPASGAGSEPIRRRRVVVR